VPSQSLPALCVVLVTGVAALTDLKHRLIPNWLTLPSLGGALLVHACAGGLTDLTLSALSAILCFAPACFLFTRGALGGGDVKLFAALGAFFGVRDGLELELTAFMLVAGFALWSMAWHGRLWALLRASWRATLHLIHPARFERPPPSEGSAELPMGGAIFAATAALLLRNWL